MVYAIFGLSFVSLLAIAFAVYYFSAYHTITSGQASNIDISDIIYEIKDIEDCDNVLILTHKKTDEREQYKALCLPSLDWGQFLDLAFFTLRHDHYWCFENELNLMKAMGTSRARIVYTKQILYDVLHELENSSKPEPEKKEWREYIWKLID